MKPNKLQNFSRKSMISFFLALLAILLIFMFRKPLFILLLIFIGGFSTIHKRVTNISFGFEFITLFSVVITYAYGIPVGLISAYLMLFISHFTLGNISASMFARMGTYTLIVIFAGLLSGYPISIIGIICGVIVYTLTPLLKIFVFGLNPVSSILSAACGIIFNYIFFTKLAEILLNILI